MHHRNCALQARLMAGAAALALAGAAFGPALAQEAQFDIPAQSLASALNQFGAQSDTAVLVKPDLAAAKTSPGVSGAVDAELALNTLLAGTGLTYQRDGDTFLIVQGGEGGGPQSASAGDGAGADVEALIVTAQKREEAIQDVPIAISAFTQKALEEQKIEGGFDLLKAIPNVTFSKSNFSSYNFSIRGVGTKAISATTDPGVAVAFNNTTLVQNRLFEQEYFDIERVEVLRGPQGTLYGRNATSGVINVLSAKPKLGEFEGSFKLEGGNFDTQRAVGMINIPIVGDVLAVRVAGAMTQRDGYDYNQTTGNNVNGRDLWSARVSVGFEPNPAIRANLVWERFEEDDDRSRTGKQLCHRDPGPDRVGTFEMSSNPNAQNRLLQRALFSQGCKPGSLYADAAFGTPNGLALPFVFGSHFANTPDGTSGQSYYPLGVDPVTGRQAGLLRVVDPYGGRMQSRDLRTIASIKDPIYHATADLFDLGVSIDLGEALTFISQTVYNEDTVYSFQDFNRFNSDPIFLDTSNYLGAGLTAPQNPSPGGIFTDPQLGPSDRIVGFDISQAASRQFSQEFRLQSDFDGPVNFSLGANYTRFSTLIDYYVFYNVITALAQVSPFNGTGTQTTCSAGGYNYNIPGPLPIDDPRGVCPYIDPNPLVLGENFQGDGHNYFRSKNPYKLQSSAGFGEVYWNIQDDLKLTAGLRYTDDTKTFTPVPSQVLLAQGFIGGGTVTKGYPALPDIEQRWGEFTGRVGIDWKPVLPFTDQTMVYAFYSRGYKGGGANPPSPGFATIDEVQQQRLAAGLPANGEPILYLTAVEYGRTFEPEFVNAYEVGAKNTLLGGAMTFNATAFYYDYADYQVSQIRDRTAVNENFDAKIWGLEFETVFQPSRNLRINANLGYLDTEIADGETSIDTMNRTQSDPDYIVVKPWPQLPSNCVIPTAIAEAYLRSPGVTSLQSAAKLCGGMGNSHLAWFIGQAGNFFDFDLYPELNGGAGIKDQLGGNELPNAPHWTSNLGAQYGFDAPGGWRTTIRGDAYWQSQSWARVYNAVNDKLHGWYNVNLSVWAEQPDWGVKVELYAKNLLNDTPITDAFLLSDDTALVTNVFTLDPRVVGLSVRKEF